MYIQDCINPIYSSENEDHNQFHNSISIDTSDFNLPENIAKYDKFVINKYSLPKGLTSNKKTPEHDINKDNRIKLKNSPLMRKGMIGWKLSQESKNENTKEKV